MAEEIDFENGRNSNFEGLVTLTLTFDPAIWHTVVHHSSTSTYIPNFIQIEETFCGHTDGRTGGRTFFPSILLGRLSEVDLKKLKVQGLVKNHRQNTAKPKPRIHDPSTLNNIIMSDLISSRNKSASVLAQKQMIRFCTIDDTKTVFYEIFSQWDTFCKWWLLTMVIASLWKTWYVCRVK